MTDLEPRLFADDAAVRRIGEGLLGCSLVREDWTHEAHLAACLYLLAERPDIRVERDLPDIIRRFNVSVGGINDESQGYHETITQAYVAGVRLFLAEIEPHLGLAEKVNSLLRSPQGRRDWPLRFYTRERLFSVSARLGFVEPDLEPLPSTGVTMHPSPIRLVQP